MIVVGIHDGHNASVCLLKDGKIVYALQEERLTGIKNYSGFPHRALKRILSLEGISIRDVDVFAFASKHMPIPKSTKEVLQEYAKSGSLISHIKWTLKHTPIKKVHRHLVRKKRLEQAHRAGIPFDRIVFVEHHWCHASAAYWGSPFRNKKVLVFTCDGSGDELCATVSLWNEQSRAERLLEINERHSIARLYANITFLLGFIPLEHEYKLMGMAPYASERGSRKVYEIFKQMYASTGEDGTFKLKSSMAHMFTCIPYLARKLRHTRFDWICGGLQMFFEEVLTTWIKYWIDKTGIRTIALAGGAFLNVKTNKKVMELPQVEEIFVYPSCGDETNVMGAAYWISSQAGYPPEPLGHFYLGDSIHEKEAEEAIKKLIAENNVKVSKPDNLSRTIAQLLSRGEVIARACGRMEFGARALGNRSILANPSRWETITTINKMIKKRDFWMPFAPSLLAEHSEEYLIKPKPVPAPYMILTFDTKPEVQDYIQAAIHPYDRTARPQEVFREWNPEYWQILEEYRNITGLSAILNTSFNLHGYPIVRSAEEAVFVFRNSGLKYLVLDGFLIEKR